MMENRARICTAIALVLVVSVLAQANSAPAGGEDGQRASGQPAGDALEAADTLSESSQRRAMAFSLVARQRLGAGDSEAAIMALQAFPPERSQPSPDLFSARYGAENPRPLPLAIRVLRSYIRLGEDQERLQRAQ